MADIMLLFGSGGHSSEMLMLAQNAKIAKKLELNTVNRLTCVISDDDRLVLEKIDNQFRNVDKKFAQKRRTIFVARPRQVGQSFLTSILTTLIGLVNTFRVVREEKPTLCLTNGPGISVVTSITIRLLQLISFRPRYRCHIIYIESFCRTKTLSLSGKLIYYLRLADEFYVQWKDLHIKYPRAKFQGILV